MSSSEDFYTHVLQASSVPDSTSRQPSLLSSVMNDHANAVREFLPDAEPIQVQVHSLQLGENQLPTTSVLSEFASSRDKVYYLSVHQNIGEDHLTIRKYAFNLGDCYRGPMSPPPNPGEYKNCGKPTGEQEENMSRLFIRNWRVDLSDIIAVGVENGFSPTKDFTVATPGGIYKFSYYYYKDLESSMLGSLPEDKTIILFVDGDRVIQNGVETAFGRYLILDAENGKILEKGFLDPPENLPPAFLGS